VVVDPVRRCATRHARYRGLAKTGLEHTLIAGALNLCRLDAWQTGTLLGSTRISHHELTLAD
jgi:hypothetical protein